MKRRVTSDDDLPIDEIGNDGDLEEAVVDKFGRPGPGSAGQSGDTQGLSGDDEGSSESVLELIEEGQAFEAGIVSGIEDAPEADAGPIKTREVLEDDVPLEYDERDPGDQR